MINRTKLSVIAVSAVLAVALRRQRFFRTVLRVRRLCLCTGFQHCRPGSGYR